MVDCGLSPDDRFGSIGLGREVLQPAIIERWQIWWSEAIFIAADSKKSALNGGYMKLVEAAQEVWKLLWIPIVFIFLFVAICQFIYPSSLDSLQGIVEAPLEIYTNFIDLVSQTTTKMHLDIIPSVLSISIVAMLLQFLRGPLFHFISRLPPRIGWLSGMSLRFASSVDLALLKKRYPNAESSIQAYSMAIDQLRNEAANSELFSGPLKPHGYVEVFSKYCILVAIILLIVHIVFGRITSELLWRCILILCLSIVLWVMAIYRRIIHIRVQDFRQWQAIKNDLHRNSILLQGGEELSSKFSVYELAILEGRWWYIQKITPSLSWFSAKEFIRGFRGID